MQTSLNINHSKSLTDKSTDYLDNLIYTDDKSIKTIGTSAVDYYLFDFIQKEEDLSIPRFEIKSVLGYKGADSLISFPRPKPMYDIYATAEKMLLATQSKVGLNQDVHEKVFRKILVLKDHIDNDSEQLTNDCIVLAMYIGSLIALNNFLPARISKSLEGSISFEFEHNDGISAIEVFNDEEIVFMQDRNDKISAKNLVKEELALLIYELSK